MAVRERAVAREVTLWARRAEAIDELRRLDAADQVSGDLAEVVDGAELVVVATPVGALADLVERVLPALPEGGLVTDLCSVKAAAVRAADAAIAASGRGDVRFVGAHPMAGSDRTGFAHARADLFSGAPCAITPGATSDRAAVAAVGEFWTAVGCRTLELDPVEHDRLVARVSHLPHLAASVLVGASIGDQPGAGALAGPGFRDTTRVAAGSPEMWAEILAEHREEVSAALEAYIEDLGEVLAKLREMDNGGLHRLLAEARDQRATLYAPDGTGRDGAAGA